MWEKILNGKSTAAGLAKIHGELAEIISHHYTVNDDRASTQRPRTTRLIRIIGAAGGLTLLLALPVQEIYPQIRTIKVPGPYPYEEPVRILAPPDSESAPSSSPAPVGNAKSAFSPPAAVRHSVKAHRPLSAETVRKAAFKYNGVANFCEFLAVLPVDVAVFDPKLGTTRALVKGGRVINKNIAWLRRSRQGRYALARAEDESKKANKRSARRIHGFSGSRSTQQRFHGSRAWNS